MLPLEPALGSDGMTRDRLQVALPKANTKPHAKRVGGKEQAEQVITEWMQRVTNGRRERGKYSEHAATTPLRKEWYAVNVYMKCWWRESNFRTEIQSDQMNHNRTNFPINETEMRHHLETIDTEWGTHGRFDVQSFHLLPAFG